MKMDPTQINGYNPLDTVRQKNESPNLETTSDNILDESLSDEEKNKSIQQQNISIRDSEVLSGTEQAILHGLFGSKEPSELSFYGPSNLRHIHKGQLMDISA